MTENLFQVKIWFQNRRARERRDREAKEKNLNNVDAITKNSTTSDTVNIMTNSSSAFSPVGTFKITPQNLPFFATGKLIKTACEQSTESNAYIKNENDNRVEILSEKESEISVDETISSSCNDI